MKFVRRYLKRRKLAPVVGVVPAVLRRSYGGKEFYSVGQLARVVETLRLKDGIVLYAYVACCAENDFLAALPAGSSENYRRYRTELADLFSIDRPDFTCRHMLTLRNIPLSNKNAIIRDGEQGTHGGGVPYDGSMM